jgi:hypothetical protein
LRPVYDCRPVTIEQIARHGTVNVLYKNGIFVSAAMTLLPKFGRYPAIAGKAAGEPVAKPAILYECAGFCFFGTRTCNIARNAEGGDELINTPDRPIIFIQTTRSTFLKGETTYETQIFCKPDPGAGFGDVGYVAGGGG